MLNIVHNSSLYKSMEPFNLMKELEDLDDHNVLLMKEEMLKLDGTWDTYQDLIDKYISLHGAYTKELENSKKIKKSLAKCLKFYSKLCKKYEVQQKINQELEENIKQKTICLEESARNQEKMKGLIEIYESERSVYCKDLSSDLRRDKEILLEICCKLIGESVKTNNIKSLANLILKKFKKDLDSEKLNVLIRKDGLEKYELGKAKNLNLAEDVKPTLVDIGFSDKKFIQSNDFDCETKAKKERENNKNDTDLAMVEKDLEETLESTDSQSKVLISENFEHKIGSRSHVCEENMLDSRNGSVEDITTELNQQYGKVELEDEPEYQLPELFDSLFDEDRGLTDSSYTKCSNVIGENKTESKNTTLSVDSFISSKTTLLDSNKLDVLGEENSTLEEVTNHGSKRNFSEDSATEFRNSVNVSDVNSSLFDAAKLSNDNGPKCDKGRKQYEISKKPKTSLTSLFDIPEVENENRIIYSPRPLEFEYCDKKSNSGEEFEIGFEKPPDDWKNHNSKEGTHVRELSFNGMIASDLLSDGELSNIFKAMSSVERLSPIREIKPTTSDTSPEYYCPRKISETDLLKTDAENSVKIEKKRNRLPSVGDTSSKKKKSKLSNETNETEKKDSGHLLDSIISAMTVQNEIFKSNTTFPKGDEFRISSNDEVKKLGNDFTSHNPRRLSQGKEELKQVVVEAKEETPVSQISKTCEDSASSEKMVLREIKNFVSSPISSHEHAQACVQRCISVLANKSDEVVAKSMVAIVFENVNEEVTVLERPAPPMTRSEQRLMVLLSVFNTLQTNCENICSVIMTKISEKLFPDVFFWPDVSIEAASRFYTALCKKQNDVQSILKFFLKAMTEMKARCFVAVFTALKTWPDILQNASVLRNNILAVTIVNVFLHMPKKSMVPHKYGRLKKLLALKHLLMNFYEFKVDESIEAHGKKILESFLKEEINSVKALMLLCSNQEYGWIKRNIIPDLKKMLVDWSQGKLRDSIGIKVLSVIKHIGSEFEKTDAEANEMISNLSQVLNCGKLEHSTELSIIELLLKMKQFAESRKIIGEWIPRCEISKSLRDEIIEVSAENVLRELKPHRSMTEGNKYGKFKRQNKGKKKTGKKWRKAKNRAKIKENESASKNLRKCVKRNYF